MIRTLLRLSREANRYRTLYIVAIFSTLALTAVNLTAPKALSSMTAIVEDGADEQHPEYGRHRVKETRAHPSNRNDYPPKTAV
ncbi:MAG: hypothetical protein IKQ41_13635 [Clostridia bacterium]|nr:hypothetical protein [Clostridia bacterium]